MKRTLKKHAATLTALVGLLGGAIFFAYKHYRPYGGPSRLFVGDMIALWSGFRNGANVAKPGLPSHGTESRARVTRGTLF